MGANRSAQAIWTEQASSRLKPPPVTASAHKQARPRIRPGSRVELERHASASHWRSSQIGQTTNDLQ